ncbi:MAG: MobA/MobL family protein, partial [Coprococcus sp.]
HNKRKTNYHIHLIFAERQLLDKPIEKIATRNMFYDEKGKHRRTKKEILDEAGNIRKRCKVIRKGEVYEQNLFTKKNELFKADGFLDEVKRLYTELINVCAIKEEDKLHVFDRNGMYLATKKIGKNNSKAAEIEADNMERVRWNQAVDRALISGVAKEDILDVKREKISKEVKRSIELYGNNAFFLVGIIRLAIKALELLISKVLLAAAKVAEKIVDVVHEKVVEKEVPALKEEPEQAVVVQDEIQFPKKPEEPLLLSKYPVIMELDAELKRRNEELFVIEQERSNLEIELSECTGVFKKKQRKELQERISLLDKKAEKMKSELSRMLQDAGYANASEFFTELFAVREEKRKYEEACKEWQEECVMAEIEATKDNQHFGDVRLIERGRRR